MSALKVVFVGNAKSGKTRTTRVLLGYDDSEYERYVPTLGAAVHQCVIEDKKSGSETACDRSTACEIWDTAGEDNFRGLGDAYYMNAKIVFIHEGGENGYHR